MRGQTQERKLAFDCDGSYGKSYISFRAYSRKERTMKLYGGIEAGGTKFVCAVATSPTNDPVSTLMVDTTTPDETLGRVIRFFRQHDLKAVGIASFGPIDLRRESPTYGYITATPKPGW